MVSPVKKTKASSKDVKYTFPGQRSSKITSVKSVKHHLKPFARRIFYVDLRSRQDTLSLEAGLKSLGATIAVFLDRNVTHFVTDKPRGSSSAVASPAASVSPSPSHSDRSPAPRSRSAVMLEKVTAVERTSYCDSIALAQQWRIPVLSASCVWREVAKYLAKREAPLTPRTSSKFTSYVKLESVDGYWAPDLLKVAQWPTFDLDSTEGQGPFHWDAPRHGVNLTAP